MVPLVAAGIAQGVGGIIKGVSGAIQAGQGRRMLRRIGDSPTEVMPDEIGQNVRDAGIDAAVGLPSAVYNQAMRNISRNQLSAMTSLSGRGRLMALPGLLDATNSATMNLDSADANARTANKQRLYGARSAMAGWKDKLWNVNVKTTWDNKYNYAMGLMGQGNANLVGGLSDIASGAITAATAKKDNK